MHTETQLQINKLIRKGKSQNLGKPLTMVRKNSKDGWVGQTDKYVLSLPEGFTSGFH